MKKVNTRTRIMMINWYLIFQFIIIRWLNDFLFSSEWTLFTKVSIETHLKIVQWQARSIEYCKSSCCDYQWKDVCQVLDVVCRQAHWGKVFIWVSTTFKHFTSQLPLRHPNANVKFQTHHRSYFVQPNIFVQTSQELLMLSSVTLNGQLTKIVLNSGSRLSEL